MKSLLLTGGTGFFGQAFTRYLLRNTDCERICIYSRGEYLQALMRLATPTHDVSRLRFFVGDVRDVRRLSRAMQGCDAVVHAAALKRVEVGEYCPDEMVRTNVHGAMNVIDAASSAGVQKVVFLSSDKACNPVNAYGATKLLAEKLFLAANVMRQSATPMFSAVRYGNIAGSTGSVIPTWRKAIADGRRFDVTDPSATRFWMTIEDACEMVAWVLKTMSGGELVVPSLPAYRLGDLVKAMTKSPEQYLVTGLRQGEKLHESMIGRDEIGEFQYAGKYWIKGREECDGPCLTRPLTSDNAVKFDVDSLRLALGKI